MRKIRFFQPAAYLSIDYAAQKVEMWRLVKGDGPMPSIEGGELPVVNEEPLKRELEDFVDAVVSRRPPLVTGEQGRRALALATTDYRDRQDDTVCMSPTSTTSSPISTSASC